MAINNTRSRNSMTPLILTAHIWWAVDIPILRTLGLLLVLKPNSWVDLPQPQLNMDMDIGVSNLQ